MARGVRQLAWLAAASNMQGCWLGQSPFAFAPAQHFPFPGHRDNGPLHDCQRVTDVTAPPYIHVTRAHARTVDRMLSVTSSTDPSG